MRLRPRPDRPTLTPVRITVRPPRPMAGLAGMLSDHVLKTAVQERVVVLVRPVGKTADMFLVHNSVLTVLFVCVASLPRFGPGWRLPARIKSPLPRDTPRGARSLPHILFIRALPSGNRQQVSEKTRRRSRRSGFRNCRTRRSLRSLPSSTPATFAPAPFQCAAWP